MKRIALLESLRGTLALWVVVGHALEISGYRADDLGPLGILTKPGYAVDVFIILSGFVIFLLLDTQRLGYRQFICRRFFRLAPLFLVALALSALLFDQRGQVLDMLPWSTPSMANQRAIHADTLAFFTQHLLLHLTMLHGLANEAILPNSGYAFVGQAWSISVEWQFYLVAPFLFWLGAARRWHALAAVVSTICILRFLNYGGPAFAISQMGYFLVGILSYFAYKRLHLMRIDQRLIDSSAIIGVAISYTFLGHWVSLAIWSVVFALLVASQQNSQTIPQRLCLAVLHHPVALWLGKISYSIYLVHMIVIYRVADIIGADFERASFLAILLPAAILISVALSALTFRLIEKPGIALGQRLSSPQPSAPPAVSAERA